MIDNEKLFRNHNSSLKLAANKTVVIVCAVSVLLSIFPFARYFAWLPALVYTIVESKSDFVIFSSAQQTAVYLVYGIFRAVIDYPVAIFIRFLGGSISFGAALAGDFLALLFTILTTAVFIICTLLAVLAAIRAYNYIQARIIIAAPIADKLCALASKLRGE